MAAKENGFTGRDKGKSLDDDGTNEEDETEDTLERLKMRGGLVL